MLSHKLQLLINRVPKTIFLSHVIFKAIKKIFNPYLISSFSQFGEDRFLDNYFGNKEQGFYVEVGCNHPIAYSNTWKLYLRGWQGITIDANPELIKTFKKIRPKDISLAKVVSDENKIVKFFFSEKSTLISGVDAKLEGNKRTEENSKVVEIKAEKLEEILNDNQCPEKIDFLCIDVEGEELNILNSLNITRYRPRLILVEIHKFDILQANVNPIYTFLSSHDYKLVGYLSPNAFFVSKS
ncbi:FkbM family methyltransferase [Nodularia chucula]|uniref:FkbM family methyltransferase n=1 Tax=Nodularia chucula TaxID=3093667 RepID=UPI0039C5F9D7